MQNPYTAICTSVDNDGETEKGCGEAFRRLNGTACMKCVNLAKLEPGSKAYSNEEVSLDTEAHICY